MACEHCEIQSFGKEKNKPLMDKTLLGGKALNNGIEFYLTVAQSSSGESYLSGLIGRNGVIPYSMYDMEISYCPICGRKLGDTND